MDTAAYLTNQGWRGNGHALHHTGRGITKPILISKKTNVLGVGMKKIDAYADQWWARAFNDTLNGLKTTQSTGTGRTEGLSVGTSTQAQQMVVSREADDVRGGLYSNFIKGESLSGTLTMAEGVIGNRETKSTGSCGENHSIDGNQPVRSETQENKTSKRRRNHGSVGTTTEAVESIRKKKCSHINENGVHGESKVTPEKRQHKDLRRRLKAEKRRVRTQKTSNTPKIFG